MHATQDVTTRWPPIAGPGLEAALEKILRYLNRVSRPAFVGEVSLEIGYSLARTEAYLEVLVDRGLVRSATIYEIRGISECDDAHVYVLTGRAKPSLAYRE